MKAFSMLFVAAAMALALSACGGKKDGKEIITKKPGAEAPASPVKMQDYKRTETVDWLGKQYKLSVIRKADVSRPVFTDDTGEKYYDNKIDVTVTRPDGTMFFSRTFTKESFVEQVGEEYLKKSALLGVVLDHAEGDYIVLAVSVGAPDILSDDYVPLLINISRMGEMTVKRDTRLDGDIDE